MPTKIDAVVGRSRNCPECRNWWFDRMRHGCSVDDKRPTNTTAQLGSQFAAGPCKDFKPRREV